MAIALIGLGLALSAFALQWYLEKKADEEESRAKKGRHRKAKSGRR
jgi:hypothetical protein